MASSHSHHVRMLCPHCDQEIRVGVSFQAVGKTRKGPTSIDLGPETNQFIVSAIDDFKLSFGATGKLLEEREILTPRGAKRWFANSVKRAYDAEIDRRAARVN